MKKLILIVGITAVAGVAIAHWYFSDRGRFTTTPELTGLSRSVSASDLVSEHDPAAILRFDSAFQHIGGHKFILYGVADTEQHIFVETANENKLKGVYWLQYEAYLPGKSYTYDYDDSPLRMTLGDYEFYADTAAELEDGGANSARWPAVEQAHLDRIRNTLSVLPLAVSD